MEELRTRVSMVVNGRKRTVDVEPRMLLAHVLRDELGLTGTHIGCDTSQCGACTILVDGLAVKSCTVLAVQVDGCEVTTIEGIGDIDDLHPVQEGFWEKHGLQCGFCTPGVIMTAAGILRQNPNLTDEEIREGLEGVICRCTGYQNIVQAVRYAADKMQSTDTEYEVAATSGAAQGSVNPGSNASVPEQDPAAAELGDLAVEHVPADEHDPVAEPEFTVTGFSGSADISFATYDPASTASASADPVFTSYDPASDARFVNGDLASDDPVRTANSASDEDRTTGRD